MKIYQIHFSASEQIQKLRLAAGTPQSWGITDIPRTYHLRRSVLFLILLFLGWKYIRYIIQYWNKFRIWDWQLRLFNLEGLQTFLARIILGDQFFFKFFRFGMKIYQIHYSATEQIQKLRLAAGTPQSWGITDISRAYHLGRSVLFLILLFLGWKYIRYIFQHPNKFRSWDWQLGLLNLEGLQTFLARIILEAQFFC
jgi:uncharacterized membrane protein YhdT